MMPGESENRRTQAPGPLPAEHAQAFAEAIPHLAWMADSNGDIFWWNRRWYEYTGLTEEAMRGAAGESVHDPAAVMGERERWRESISVGRPFEMEIALRGADGTYRPFITRAVPVRDSAGNLQNWVGTNTDVSPRKKAEATLRLALDAAYLVAFVWEIPAHHAWSHHDTDEMMRRTAPAPDAIEDVRRQVHPEDLAMFDANIQAALQDPVGVYQSEYRLMGLDGRVRWLSERGRVEFGANRQALRLIGLSQDITDRKTAEKRAQDAQLELQRYTTRLELSVAERTARLQELVNELGTFSYSISHDLRAPLRSIQGFAELLREDVGDSLPEQAKSHLDRIIRASQRMDALIRDVLAYSRITRAELVIESVDPTELVRETIESHEQLQLPAAEIEIIGKLPRVRASRPAMTQVIQNLLANAVKFVTPGVTPHVRIGADVEGGNVKLWVEDNGIGIASQNFDKIWGMLERLNANYEGTGVGLSIVRKAVERMEGKVGLASELGKGSRFWIQLPAA